MKTFIREFFHIVCDVYVLPNIEFHVDLNEKSICKIKELQ